MPLNIFVLGSYISNISEVLIWDFPLKYGIPLTVKNYVGIFERFKDDIISEQPDIVGISCTSGDEYIPTLRVAHAVKEVLPGTTVIVGGYHASSCAEEMLMETKDIDCIAAAEGEETLKRVVQNKIDKKPSLQNVQGIVTFKNEKMIRTDPICIDINNLPFLDKQLVEYAEAYPSIAVESSRGCPFRCNFCQEGSIPNRRKWRAKNHERAIEEIEFLFKNFDNNYFFFCDTLFGASEKWTLKFCRKLNKKRMGIQWFAQVRVTLKREILREMSRAGAYSLYFGLESGSQRILELMNKVPGAENYTQYLRKAQRAFLNSVSYGIIPVIGLILGYPGENKRSMEETRDYVKRVVNSCINGADIGVSIDPMFYFPLPKTAGFEFLKFYEGKFGTRVLNGEWWRHDFPFTNYFNTVTVIPSHKVSIKDLRRQKEILANMSFYTKKSYKYSFWCYTSSPEIQSLRQRMLTSDNFHVRGYLEVALANWKNQRKIEKFSLAGKIRRRLLPLKMRYYEHKLKPGG